ncbi:LysM peptidoglycan-binding domain-containing protein [Flammeovirga pectinis]|uniref:LysM peptidoglycan-binding domain-containing protein n=1 Tax=Flammeovirga pectinis TaxID=2494373 RepID=A0A3Q9FM67_9BACT|nr:M23 family metallopeptidase [Flammeovirga pectinis]AZQ62901.1 LysM peptidoglycan-binding domain-containing protein [Flammeovirga pectinis]
MCSKNQVFKPTFVYLTLFFILLSFSPSEVVAQGFFKKIFKGKNKTESIDKKEITPIVTLPKDTFTLENGEEVCQQEDAISQIPEKYKRIDFNKTEQCENLVELQPGQFCDATYLDGFDYYKTWDNWNVNPYNISSNALKDSIALQLYTEGDSTGWAYPLSKKERVTSKYGFRRWRFHHGIDTHLSIGDSIHAMFDGVIRIAKYNRRGYGYYVMIRHKNGLETLYGHMSRYIVKAGQEVKAGEVIGLGGNTGRSTGPHLHFEIRYQGYGFNPQDLIDFENHSFDVPANFDLTAKSYELLIESKKSVYHRIRSGDSLWKISRRYGTSMTKICRLNGISKRTTLRVGRTIRVR